MSGRYSPKTSRSVPHTSPTLARAFSASRIGGSRLSVPSAACLSAANRSRVSSMSRSALNAFRRSTWAFSDAGSTDDLLDLGRVLDELVHAHHDVLLGAVAL